MKAGAEDTASHPGNHLRFHLPHKHLAPAFGDNLFGRKAEAFARFFGTSKFLIGQTLVVAAWIIGNIAGLAHFDVYPFILLNLAFSLQAAYAAPLILLAQTRQADRDKANAEADAKHREELARIEQTRQDLVWRQTQDMAELLRHNTALIETTQSLSARIEKLTEEVHARIVCN